MIQYYCQWGHLDIQFYKIETDISKFYPSPLARDKILISSNPCWNSKHILASMIYFLINLHLLSKLAMRIKNWYWWILQQIHCSIYLSGLKFFDSDMPKSTNTVVYFDWKTVINIYGCRQCRTQYMLPNSSRR
jgi:hypothetical protein